MDITERMKLSAFAKLNGISYKTGYRLFESGEMIGIKLSNGTILIEGWKVNEETENDS